MHQQPTDPATEVKRLERCVNDLVSVLALPAVWSGSEPSRILETFLDALLGMLDLDFLYTRVRLDSHKAPIDALRTAQLSGPSNGGEEIRQALNQWFGEDAQQWPKQAIRHLGGLEVSVFPTRVGLEGELGFIVAGSRRIDFPEQTESLVLRVAANQLAIGLQQALLTDEQERAASEVDRRVGERTGELAEANKELQLQVGLLQHLPASAWTLKPDGTPDFVNQVWLEFSGQTLDFVRSHPEAWMTAVHPDDREQASRTFWDGVRSGQGFAFETRSLRALDGTYRWHLQQAVVLRDAEGKVLKFVGATTDIDDQKRAEEALRVSEANLRHVIDAIPTLSWCALPDGPNEFLSKGWHEYTGLSPEKAHGWGWQAAFHPEDVQRLNENWKELLVSGQPGEIEARLRRHDGVYRWFLMRAQPFRDNAGKIFRWYGTSTDIDDRKRAEDALRASENNLRQIVDSIPGYICAVNSIGEVEYVNQRFLAYYDKTFDELKDWSANETVHPDDLTRVIDVYSKSIASEIPLDTEHRCRRADGVYRWFHFRSLPVRDACGQIARWYILGTDIEDRKRAEEALRASERDLSSIINTIPAMAWSTQADGFCDFTNQHWLDFTGLSAEQWRGWGWGAAIHPDDLNGLVEYWQAHLRSGSPVDTEARMRRFDGEYRWFLFRANPLRDESGNIVRWYGTNTDIDDRKRAEEALRVSENNFRQIVDGIPGLVTTMTPSGELELVNRRFLDYYGKTMEEMKGWATNDSIHPDDLARSIEAFTNSMKAGTPHELELRCRRADGVYRWFQLIALPVRDTEARITRWYVLMTDIDDRKRAAEELQASESNLRQILDSIPGLVGTLSPDGEVELVNRQSLDFFGLTLEQLAGWRSIGFIHPDDIPSVNANLRHVLTTGTSLDYEIRYRRADGEYRWFQVCVAPVRDNAGQITRWYTFSIDVHDRKRAEEALRTRESNLHQITETIPEMLWSASADGGVEYCNGRLLDYTGISLEQIMSDGWMTLLHPEDVQSTVEAWRACVRSGTPYRVEVRAFHAADNTYRWCVTSALPLLDQEGRIVKWHGTVVDMHDWKQAQEELRNTQAELARMTRIMTVGQLTASIAHEVSQPLSGVITNANTCLRMLRSHPPNILAAQETVLRAIRDGNRASDVITRLRTLFSKKQIDLEPLDLNETVREVIALLTSELQRNNVILKFEFGDNLRAVRGDRVQLQQVILNLLRNGSDAMVTVNDRPRQLFIRTETDGNQVTVSVQDSGVGFSPEISERLFQPLFTTKQEGMGVGLSVSRSIVEAHHGRLWAVQNDGPGATFAFSIPQGGPLPDEAE
jgi:PAS domain S-box-containing protein